MKRYSRSYCKYTQATGLQQRTLEKYQSVLYTVDYSKAFDCVDHEKVWVFLKERGVPQHLIFLIFKLYCGHEATVRL